MTHHAFLLALTAALLGAPALAQDASHAAHGETHHDKPESSTVIAGLEFSGAFLRATLPGAPVGGGYVTIANRGAADARLVGVVAPVGERAEIHEMADVEGVMTMRALRDGIAIPAGESVSLAPGGLHIMILGLTEPLKKGETLTLELEVERAGILELLAVPFEIKAINARAADPHGGHAGAHGAHPQDGGGN